MSISAKRRGPAPLTTIGKGMYTIREILTTEVIFFWENTPLTEVLQSLIENKISGAPVVSCDNQIVGVVSEADLLRLFWDNEAKVAGDIMTRDPWSFSQEEPLHEVVDCLMTHDFRRVLIHDGKNRLVGLISRANLMPIVLKKLMEYAGK
jgi:predicted transcriptional regulator